MEELVTQQIIEHKLGEEEYKSLNIDQRQKLEKAVISALKNASTIADGIAGSVTGYSIALNNTPNNTTADIKCRVILEIELEDGTRGIS